MYTQNKTKDKLLSTDTLHTSGQIAYPVDMSQFLTLKQSTLDTAGVLYQLNPAGYNPTTIAQYALAHWNQYLASHDETHYQTFLAQASWLIEHESHIGEDAGGWPISFPLLELNTGGSYLSALTQGIGISVLVKAYQLTGNQGFLDVTDRVIRTFERDILDGGVSSPLGVGGIFFEEIAIYPASHNLSGCIFAILGLYDYVRLTGNVQVEELIQCSLATMHTFLDEFDAGCWTYTNLLHRHLASPSHLALQAMLLDALASYTSCNHCSMLASRWKSYQCQPGPRFRYWIASGYRNYGRVVWRQIQKILFPQPQVSDYLRVCISVPAFPDIGGILTFLAKISQVTRDKWQQEYLTQHIGPNSEGYVIHRFGTRRMTPWYFPFIWLYILAGLRKLISLIHRGSGYQVILAQDGVFTGAFSALAAKLAGRRVVCIDHGDLSLVIGPNSQRYRAERLREVTLKEWHWFIRLVARLLLVFYWPSRSLLAHITAHLADHYLIPGVPDDGVNEICKQLGIRPSRITRFANMIDIDRHAIPDAESRAMARKKIDIVPDATVIAIICRLAQEKGLEIALEAISQALSALSKDLRTCVRVIIVGDGPLRKQLEQDIEKRKLSEICRLWGEASMEVVASILGISDIFLYTSWRGAGYPLAILEAMASGCAVIASTEPKANTYLLAEERGIAIPPGDVRQTSMALVRLLNNPELCHRMGRQARDYIMRHHNPDIFRRTLMRATCWAELDHFLTGRKGSEGR